jgi:hypothetical protein
MANDRDCEIFDPNPLLGLCLAAFSGAVMGFVIAACMMQAGLGICL